MQQSFFVPHLGTSDASAFDYYTAIDAIFAGVPVASPVVREAHPLVAHAAGVEQGFLLEGSMPSAYDGGIITAELYWLAATAVAGNVVWTLAWERLNQFHVVTPPSFSPAKSAVSPAPPVNQIQKATIAFTQAEAAGIDAGEPYRLRLTRDGAHADDTMTGAAQFLRLNIEGI